MNLKLSSLWVGLAGLLASANAMAVAPAVCNMLAGTGEHVTISECTRSGSTSSGGYYDVDNRKGTAGIYAFAVSTHNSSHAGDPGAQFNAWTGDYVSEADWNANHGGNFDTLFGTSDTGVYYFQAGTSPIAAGSWVQNAFFFPGEPSSNFVVYGQTGNVIDQSLGSPIPAIPEPESYAMLLAGLGVLGFMGKRRKAG